MNGSGTSNVEPVFKVCVRHGHYEVTSHNFCIDPSRRAKGTIYYPSVFSDCSKPESSCEPIEPINIGPGFRTDAENGA